MSVALVVMAINISILINKEATAVSNLDAGDIVYEAIMTRSSVRSYTSQVVEQEKVEKLLRAGMAAPTDKAEEQQ